MSKRKRRSYTDEFKAEAVRLVAYKGHSLRSLCQRKGLRFEFIEALCKAWPITLMCEVLEVSRNGFYAWRKRSESERPQRHRELLAEMQAIHADKDRQCYGSPRMHRELAARGWTVYKNTVAKFMADHGLRAASSPKFKATTDSNHPHPVAENTLNREFEQASPDRVWLADNQLRPPTDQGGKTPKAVVSESRRVRAGCTWRACWTRIRGKSWAGRCQNVFHRSW